MAPRRIVDSFAQAPSGYGQLLIVGSNIGNNNNNSFVRVEKAEMTLLGSPVFKGTAQDAAISHKIDELEKAVDRLSLLHPMTPWCC